MQANMQVGIGYYGAKEGERISLCMIVKDEEELLDDLLFKVVPWVDELIVVDTGSEDGGPEIVERYGGTLLRRELTGSFADTRNFGLEHATGDWIFVLDADEEPTADLLQWIRDFVHSALPTTRSLMVSRENRIDGELLPLRGRELHLRLFRRGAFRYQGALHEQPVATFGGSRLRKVAPPHLVLKHYKTDARQQRTNEFYRRFARELDDPRLIAIQGGEDKAPSGRAIPPQMEHGCPLRLNLGAGTVRVKGFYSVDVNPELNPDFLCDLSQGLPFPDGSVDEIYASHVLEHFSYHRVSWVLTDWIRALKPGGKITIKCPDFEFICKGYSSGELGYLRAVQLLYGGQTIEDFDTHYTALDFPWLRSQLIVHGCTNVERRDDLRRSERGTSIKEEIVVTAVKR